MGSVGTWVFPVMWTLLCMFVASCCWERDASFKDWPLLIAEKRNELRLAFCTIWSLVGWLMWTAGLYWRAGGGC